MSEKLANKINDKIEKLPRFSQIADKALIAEKERSLSGEPSEDHGLHDPKFAKQILQMTNFTTYGFAGNRAGSFETEAFLGEDVLRGVLLAFSLREFVDRELHAYGLGKGEFWEHSMNCALSAWMIATKVAYDDLEMAFVAGLMHDIGKVILDEFLSEEREKFVDITSQGYVTPVEAERTIFGVDHAEIGAQVAAHWGFDEKVSEAIRCHHEPELAVQDPDLVTIVHLADCISVSLGLATQEKSLIGLLSGDFSGLGL